MPSPLLAPLLVLLLAAPQDPPEGEGAPDPKAIAAAAVAELDAAFLKGKTPERIGAIEKAARIADAGVVQRVAKGLDDADPKVQSAAIEALRVTDHADALAALHSTAKTNKKLRKDPELHAKLLKAIGQHGSVSSLPVLADGGLGGENAVVDARILGLANIRSKRSLEELVNLMRVADRGRVEQFMPCFRLALMRLTGADQGTSIDKWIAWWNENKKDFAVAEEPPLLPADLQRRWDSFWGNPLDYTRGAKRGDRGK
jgi:hypothetical protein